MFSRCQEQRENTSCETENPHLEWGEQKAYSYE